MKVSGRLMTRDVLLKRGHWDNVNILRYYDVTFPQLSVAYMEEVEHFFIFNSDLKGVWREINT